MIRKFLGLFFHFHEEKKKKKSPIKFKNNVNPNLVEKGFFGERDMSGPFFYWTPFEIKGNQYEVFNRKWKEKKTLEDLVEDESPDWVYLVNEPVYFSKRELLFQKDLSKEPPFNSNWF